MSDSTIDPTISVDEDPSSEDPGTEPEGTESEGDENTLGDAGKKAIDAMKGKWRAAEASRRAQAKELADLKAQIATQGKSPDEQAIEEAKRAATAEATTKANAKILRSEVRAAAAGKLADPKDALRLLDLDEFEVNEDGEVDEAEIGAAIAQLLKDKPYLAATKSGPVVPAGGIDQGARAKATPDLDDQIAEAEKAGNYGLSISLKRQKAADAAKN